MLKLSNLSVGFGGPNLVLADVRLSLDEGQRLLVCGAAGSGKTTLLNASAGLIPRLIPVASLAGSVELRGKPLSAMTGDELYRAIGVVSQNVDDQLWDISVEDVIAFPLENRGIWRAANGCDCGSAGFFPFNSCARRANDGTRSGSSGAAF